MRGNHTMNVAQIGGLLTNYLGADEAAKRARFIIADLRTIGLPIVLSREVPDAQWRSMGIVPQAEYLLPSTPFSKDAEDEGKTMEGSFLTRGNFLRLSQAVMLARRWIPKLWPHDFSARLLGPEHLDALNEIWWLKFWRSVVSVQRGPKANLATPDADWLLTIHDGLANLRINLEVKRRTGNINTLFKHRNPSVSLADIDHKFQASEPDTANVVALTIYHLPSPVTLRRISDWLEKQPNVDGVLVWIEGNLGGEPLLKFFKAKKKWAEHLLVPIDREDLQVAGYAVGTLCKKEELPVFLPKFVQSLRRKEGLSI